MGEIYYPNPTCKCKEPEIDVESVCVWKAGNEIEVSCGNCFGDLTFVRSNETITTITKRQLKTIVDLWDYCMGEICIPERRSRKMIWEIMSGKKPLPDDFKEYRKAFGSWNSGESK